MKNMKLLKAIGAADEKIIAGYEQDSRGISEKMHEKKKYSGIEQRKVNRGCNKQWIRRGIAAACLCILAAVPAVLPQWMSGAATEKNMQDSVLIGNKDTYDPEDYLPGSDILIVDGSGYSEAVISASYKSPEAGQILYFVEVAAAMRDNAKKNTKLYLGIELFSYDNAIDGKTAVEAEAERMKNNGYDVFFSEVWEYGSNGEKVWKTFLAGLFTTEELENFQTNELYGYAFRFVYNGDGSCAKLNTAGEGAAEEYEFNLIPCEMTLNEVYEDVGGLVPEKVPEGFIFEAAYRVGNEISILWTCGYDELRWKISEFSDEDTGRMTSTEDIQNYDLALYPIPRADSVPEKLREIVDNPMFNIDELTQKTVNARAYFSDESGDLNRCQMRFSVRYEEIVIEVISKGVSPEWMYEALIEIRH